MQSDRTKILVESIKRLLRREATTHLRKIVNRAHAADMSVVFRSLLLSDQHKLFDMIEGAKQKGLLFSELDEDIFLGLVEEMDPDDVAKILEQMAADDIADLMGRLPRERADAILEKMKKEGSEEVEGLLRYGDDTAGGIMVPDFIAFKEDTTAKEAMKSLQKEYLDVEMPFYLYVKDEHDRLVGVCSLRQLVVVPPETSLKNFMTTEVFSVKTDTDQEEVAKIVASYNILAVPVVDDTNRLVGIVTVDDVIDIFREEATEDMLKMAGVGSERFVESKPVFKSIRLRAPWLFACFGGGIVASFVIGHFEETLAKVIYIAAFIPIIMGMGGNVGIQSSTIVVRGLATGRFNVKDIWPVVLKELGTGLMLGLFFGLLIGAVAQVQYNIEMLTISVGLAVACAMSLAALSGALMPIVLTRLNMDPAVATGPFVTTGIDVISVLLYFIIITTLLGI